MESTVQFKVWDTGIGVNPEELEKVFEPFFQSDSGLSRTREGSGLGLALTRKLVEMQGAVISAASTDSGSSFMVVSHRRCGSGPRNPKRRHARGLDQSRGKPDSSGGGQ